MRRLYHSRVTSTHGVYTRKSTASPQINIANLVQSLLRQVEHFKGGSRSRFPKLVRQFLVLIFYCDCTCYSRDFIYTTEWTITALTVTITCSIRFFRATLCICAANVVMRCLSVRLSVTFVYSVKTNKHICNFLSLSGSHTILVLSASLYFSKRGAY